MIQQEDKEEDLSNVVFNDVEETAENPTQHVKEHDIAEEPKSIALGTHVVSETMTGGPPVGTQTSETQVVLMVGNQHPGIQNETAPPSYESISGENAGTIEVHHEEDAPPSSLDSVDVNAPLPPTQVISEVAAPSDDPSENIFGTPGAFETLNANVVPSPIAQNMARTMNQETEDIVEQEAVQEAEAVVQAIEERGGGMLSASVDILAEAVVNELQNGTHEHSYQSVVASMTQTVPELQVAVPPLPVGVSPMVEVIPAENDVLLGYFAQAHQGHGNTIFRQLIQQYSHDYGIAEKMDKSRVSKTILAQLRAMVPAMRFLKKREDGVYYEIDERKAIETVSHALRDKMEQGELIQEPTDTDILFGRGGQTNHHPGNKMFRKQIAQHKDEYAQAEKMEKPKVSRRIVIYLRSLTPKVRFLKKNEHGQWLDVGNRQAAEKVSQALRDKNHEEEGEPVAEPTDRDILFGRGGQTNHHPGNKVLRDLVTMYKDEYLQASKPEKPKVAKKIVATIRGYQPPIRFLKKKEDGIWYDIGDRQAAEKTGQALRDKGFEEKRMALKAKLDGNTAAMKGEDEETLGYPRNGGIFGEVDEHGDIKVCDSDILCGRGGLTNHHLGNRRFRDLVALHKDDYVRAPKMEKPEVARTIVRAIRSGTVPCRFLKKGEDGKWVDIGDKAATEKASQALREKGEARKENKRKGGIEIGDDRHPQRLKVDAMAIEQAPGSYIHHEVVGEGTYPVEGGLFGEVDENGDIRVTDNDILCGRGGLTNHHKGNKRFRDLVILHRPDYVAASKRHKPDVSRTIVRAIRGGAVPGRFLKKNDKGKYFDIGDKKAAEKASQALREKPEFRATKKKRVEEKEMSLVAIKLLQDGIVPQIDMQSLTNGQTDQMASSDQLEQTTAMGEPKVVQLPMLEEPHTVHYTPHDGEKVILPETDGEPKESNDPVNKEGKEAQSSSFEGPRGHNLPVLDEAQVAIRQDDEMITEINEETKVEDDANVKVPPSSPITIPSPKKSLENIAYI